MKEDGNCLGDRRGQIADLRRNKPLEFKIKLIKIE